LLYGQLGKTDLMIEMFLDEAEAHPENSIIIQNQFMRFMADGSDASLMIRCEKRSLLEFKSHKIFGIVI
jgi:hypothetical protein